MRIAIIGSSTGGPYILEEIFARFPRITGAIIIVQHLPPAFTNAFKVHLSALTKMKVIIGMENHTVSEGEIIIAPAGKHLILESNRIIHLVEGEKIHGVMPAVDQTMTSLKNRVDDRYAGIILTGMGQDGAKGIMYIKNLKGITIAQDPKTAPIASMPQSAIETGMVSHVLGPEEIRKALIRFGMGGC